MKDALICGRGEGGLAAVRTQKEIPTETAYIAARSSRV